METAESCDCRFFAVFVPTVPTQLESVDLTQKDEIAPIAGGSGGQVFTSLKEALQEVSRHKNRYARFKPFNSLESAKFYAQNGKFLTGRMLFPGTKAERVDSDVVSTTPLHAESDLKKEEVEKPMPFEKASWSALGKLKRMIEKKEKVEVVRQMLRENPRLIINSSGFVIPTIMHQGCLYQPMHIAAKAGNLDVCRLLLNCSEFMALLYPGDEKDLNETRCDDLRCGFLNRPDKFGETPLFFAVKGGHIDVAKLLLLQPQCERDLRNTKGESCYDLCDRLQSPQREQMRQMLSEHLLFVPLFRTLDNSAPPCLGKPCRHLLFESDPRLTDDLTMSPGRTVRNAIVKRQLPVTDSRGNYPFLAAWLGPCSPTQADDLFIQWSSCKGNEWAVDVKRSDLQKGMERIGRQLSDRAQVSWAEYWDFLDAFTDIRMDCGLEVFEKFLRSRRVTADAATVAVHLDFFAPTKQASVDREEEFHDSLEKLPQNDVEVDVDEGGGDELDFLCQKFALLGLNSPRQSVQEDNEDSDDDSFTTPPSSPTFFISGVYPSKVDRDVFLALANVQIDSLRFPTVHRWHQSVLFFNSEEQMKWPNFDSPRAKSHSKMVADNH